MNPMTPTPGKTVDLLTYFEGDSSKSLEANAFLPMSMDEVRERGWDEVDIVFVSGDAYVDHPSFANALLGRVLERAGYRVAMLCQPDWKSSEPWTTFGRPRLFFAISAGNMDSMINHYTAGRKVRNDDAYSPGGRIGLRPDRATLSYCHRAREAYSGTPIIAGGVEASLRRLAHYDYWSDKVRRSILLDCKADLLVYGMGEEAILQIARRLQQGESVKDLRDMRGVAYALGAKETPPPSHLSLPSFEEVKEDRYAFSEATRLLHLETNPYNAKGLIQRHDRQSIVVNPPALPLSSRSMDFLYTLGYRRRAHPEYREPIPAHEMIKDSVTIMRGCFGGCTFCSITAHQGRIIQSRSQDSIVAELREIGGREDFKGTVSDIGGPTANMYQMKCTKPEVEAICRRQSCVHPKICKLLGTDHQPLIDVMKAARETEGVKKVLVSSGIRMDLARRSQTYVRDLVAHHVGGRLKVAPEHSDPTVLTQMRKPSKQDFEVFAEMFEKENDRAGKNQFLVPYYIASHPGSDLDAMIDLAVFLKKSGHRPDQVQDFIPAPMDVATSVYHTGLDPFTKKDVYVAKHLRDRRLQRALLQFFKADNWFEVRKALLQAGRKDLIGKDPDCLIPDRPPKEALERRRREARVSSGQQGRSAGRGEKKDKTGKSSRNEPGKGYRPQRRSVRKR